MSPPNFNRSGDRLCENFTSKKSFPSGGFHATKSKSHRHATPSTSLLVVGAGSTKAQDVAVVASSRSNVSSAELGVLNRWSRHATTITTTFHGTATPTLLSLTRDPPSFAIQSTSARRAS